MVTVRGSSGSFRRVPVQPKKRRGKVKPAAVAAQELQRQRDAVLETAGIAGELSVQMRNPLQAPEVDKRLVGALGLYSKDAAMDTTTEAGRAAFRAEARRNFRFFCRHVAVIQPKSGGLVKLKWNKAQTRLALTLVRQLLDGKPMMAVVAKARQWGCSTLLTALASWRMATTDGYGVCLVIHDKKFLPEFREKYRLMLGAACRVFGHRLVTDNAEQMRLSNGSRIDFYSAGTKQTSEQIRSSTYNFAHLTEIPYWYDVKKTLGTVTSAVDLVKGNGICIESTPRGRGDAFHGLYQSAKQGLIGYAPVFVPWHELEGYAVLLTEHEENAVKAYLAGGLSTRQIAEVEAELGLVPDKDKRVSRFGLSPQQYVWWCRTFRDKATLNINTMRTEYPDDDETCFLTTGQTVVPGEHLSKIADACVSARGMWKRGNLGPDGFAEAVGGWLHLLQAPQEDAQYLIAADIAQGASDGDFTCIGVFKRETGKLTLVAGIHDHIDPAEAAARTAVLWRWYGKCMVAPESNGPGVAYILELRREGVSNIYVRQKVNTVSGGIEQKLGVQTTSSTKPSIIAALLRAVRKDELVCSWAPVYADLAMFCWKDAHCTTAAAVKGGYDDAAMMVAIACYVDSIAPSHLLDQPVSQPDPVQYVMPVQQDSDYRSAQHGNYEAGVAPPSVQRQSGSILDFL